MNIKHRRFRRMLVIAIVLIGTLAVAWPIVAQSSEPPRQPDGRRDPIGALAHLPGYTAAAESESIRQPADSDPRPWTQVAFASYRDSNWEIYTANGDGSATTRRTFNAAIDFTPDLNRGGTRVAFISDRNGNNEVYVMNADGSGQTRLTYTSADEYLPTWSPDGLKIAFYSYRDGNAEIYVMNADGSNQTRLTFNSAWDGHPAWSPDGEQIAFASARNGAYDLFKMSAQGANQTQLTSGAAYAAYPDWSPDGSAIIFNYDYGALDGFYDIATVSANGGAYTPLAYAPYHVDELGPKWDPTGKYYAFAAVSWVYTQGNWYWTTAYVRARDLSAATNWTIAGSGDDWWPDWETTDVSAPASQVTTLPTWTNGTALNVNWSGSDTGLAGIGSYDIQYRDGNGPWSDWLIATPQTSATFNGAHGHTYYFRSLARDYAGNIEAYPGDNGDAFTTVDTAAPTASAYSPPFTGATSFAVTWSGSDTVSGINSYDLQYRDGSAGVWTNWFSNVTSTASQFNGQYGHIYFFRVRARDKAGNLSPYNANGDSSTTVYHHDLAGRVLNNRAQPVAVASVHSNPTALNIATTQHMGQFHLYYGANSVVTLTAMRGDFGPLPALSKVIVSGILPTPIFYLPPSDNVLRDSHFENGDLAAWKPSGDLTPTITSTAHTGHYAALLGGTVPSDTLTSAPWHSTIEQTIALSPTLHQGTLSLLYHVQAADPLSDTLTALVIGANATLTFTLPLTETEWAHTWFDLSAWTAPTATLRLELTTPDQARTVGVVADEVTWGSAMVGSYSVFLPVVRR